VFTADYTLVAVLISFWCHVLVPLSTYSEVSFVVDRHVDRMVRFTRDRRSRIHAHHTCVYVKYSWNNKQSWNISVFIFLKFNKFILSLYLI